MFRWIVGRALTKFNDARRASNLEGLSKMPLGVPDNPKDCGGARSLRPIDPSILVADRRYLTVKNSRVATAIAEAWGHKVYEQPGFYQVYCPLSVVAFITLFDWGWLRHLIDHEAKRQKSQPAPPPTQVYFEAADGGGGSGGTGGGGKTDVPPPLHPPNEDELGGGATGGAPAEIKQLELVG